MFTNQVTAGRILSFMGCCHRQPVQIRRRRKLTECDASSRFQETNPCISAGEKENRGRVFDRAAVSRRFRGRTKDHPEIIFERFVVGESLFDGG